MTAFSKLGLCAVAMLAASSHAMMAESTQVSEMRYWFGNGEPTTINASAGEPILIPYSHTRRDLVVVFNYQVKDTAGNWSVPHRHLFMPPENCQAQMPDNLTLTLTSRRGNVKKQATVSKGQTEIDIDVKDLDPGIYGITAAFENPSNGELLGLINTFADIKPFGGNTLEGIYYWLNDSLSMMSRYSGDDALIPVSRTINVPIESNGIPSFDNKLTVNDAKAEIAPNYTIKVAFRNSSGFVVDSTAWITDNSRRRELKPLWLEGFKQHDNEKTKFDTCYWYAFNAQDGDVVDFSARRPCRIKVYDPEAELTDTATFSDSRKTLRCKISASGPHYIQVSEIEKSRQIFSTMLEYVSGPTATEISQNGGNFDHTHDGLLIEWNNASDWKNADGGISFSKSGFDLSAANVDGHREPYVSTKSNQWRVYPGNIVRLKSKGYVEKAVFCVQNAPGLVMPKIESANGDISIDWLTNCVEWSGLSDQVELTISNVLTDGDAILPINRVYVTLSELSHDDVTFDTTDDFTANATPFNMLYIWSEGKLLASHAINESSRLYIDDSGLTVQTGNEAHTYAIDKKLILTYEYSDDPGTGSIEDIEVAVSGDRLLFNSLPAFVGIYSVGGQTYYAGYVSDPEFSYPLDRLSPGVYLVKVGDKVSKIMIQ